MEVFRLKHIGKKIPELLKKEVKDKNAPERWNWEPYRPENIRNIQSIVLTERSETNYAAITNYSPSTQKQHIVLCFGMGNLSYGLLNHFEANGIGYFYLDYMQFVAQFGDVKIQLDENGLNASISIQGLTLDLLDVSVVIWSPPHYPKPLFDFEVIPKQSGRNMYLYRKRWQSFIHSLDHLLADAVWLPGKPFRGSQEWQNKLGEYYLAAKLGLKIPPTIHTNNIGAVRDYFDVNEKVLLREFSCPPFSFPPIHLDLSKEKFSALAASPCTFQKYLDKQHEYRVIVLFQKVFAVKINSQDSKLAQYDWRVHDDANVKWEMDILPKSIEDKLVKFCKLIGLNWISVDLIKGKDDEYYFLEANRPGSHYWLNNFVGLDISEKIAHEIKHILETNGK